MGLLPRLRVGPLQLMANRLYRTLHPSAGATHYALTMIDACIGILLIYVTRHATSEAKRQEPTKILLTAFTVLTILLCSINFLKYATLGSFKKAYGGTFTSLTTSGYSPHRMPERLA